MKRRNFIRSAGTVMTLPLLFKGMRLSAMTKPSLFGNLNPDNDRVLVLIQLNGGNDGLNTLVPLDQFDNLANLRTNLLLPETSILKINDQLGLHPNMTGFKSLYDDGKLGMVQNVGYPNQNRSHFRSMDIWQSASAAEETVTTGWLGRYFQSDHPDFPDNYPNEDYPDPFAITMGNVVSETCQGSAANFSLTLTDPFALSPLAESDETDTPDTPYGRELDFLRITIAQSNLYAENITAAAEKGNNMVTYPDGNGLAQQLKNVALLISGGMQTKVYVASLGGFDTHANQVVDGNTLVGDHASLLLELSDAVAAFQADLQAQGLEERVIGLTFSEFGRQIRSNFSLGTDHGTAAPLFVFGSCANPSVLGNNPDLSGEIQVQEGVPMEYDFRDIYGSVLQDWFGLEESSIRSLLHSNYQHINIIQDCALTTSTEDIPQEQMQLSAFPNPFSNSVNIRFTANGGHVRLSVFNAMGSELAILADKTLPKGLLELLWNAKQWPAGNYYYRLQEGSKVRTERFVKFK